MPQYGYFELRARASLGPQDLAAVWMIGFEDTPEHSGEITVCEIFGKSVRPGAAVLGYGIKPVNDPRLRAGDFHEDEMAFDPAGYHIYAAEWTPAGVDFFLDNRHLRHVAQSPDYPMQFMLNVYELEPTSPQRRLVAAIHGRLFPRLPAGRRLPGMSAPPPGPLIGAGKEAEVFASGDLVVKRYRSPDKKGSAFREAAILAAVESLGLPVPSVRDVRQVDGRWEIVMTRAKGPSFGELAERERHRVPEILAGMVALHRRIHAAPGAQLANLKRKLAAGIGRAEGMLGAARTRRLLDGLAARPDGDRLCHGDFHPLNIMGTVGNAVIVDWLDASCGDPVADVCRTYVLMRPHAPKEVSAYVDAYCAAAGISRDAVLAWLPFVAASRLSEGVAEEADGLMAMADAV